MFFPGSSSLLLWAVFVSGWTEGFTVAAVKFLNSISSSCVVRVQSDIFKYLVLSEQQLRTKQYWIFNHLNQQNAPCESLEPEEGGIFIKSVGI